MREVYKTAWEMKQRVIIDMAAERGAFIDQSQSLNLFLKEPSFAQLSSMHFHSWRRGLKTGMYYLRTQPATEAIKFTLPSTSNRQQPAAGVNADAPPAEPQTAEEREAAAAACALNSKPGECEMCSS